MIATSVMGRELADAWVDGDPTARFRFDFVLHAGHGAESTAAVYFELEPGARLPLHTDSAEEVLLVLEGEGVAVVGDERAPIRAGDLAVVPAHVPHGVEAGDAAPLRCIGVFAAATLEHEFVDELQPFGERSATTPPPEEPEPV